MHARRDYRLGMKLQDWLNFKDLTATAFAADVGCSVSTITRACKGERVPDPDTLKKIGEKTDGLVTPNDFMGFPGPAMPEQGAA